ncbi:MAG: CoA transferase [Xanthomonadales bacterium]|nr:CoA transferase [Xanthomonadales bacterium]MCE7930335.1 CoA transferase [Xanthomonadales bacterium PRO6]
MPPLHGLRILDLSRILAGPWATQLLADLGAEVWKIEKPGTGDDTRAWGPPWLGGEGGESAYFLSCNRGKRSLAIDFTVPAGAALVRALAGKADVLVENFKVGGLARHGLDWPALQALNPRLVYCSITGYGQDGPYAQRAGYDAAIQAQGGLMSLTGVADGEPGAGPQKVGVAVTDLMTGMYAATGILAALRHAQVTGQGQRIDLALLDTQVAALANQALNYLVSGEAPPRLGSAHPNIVPYQTFAAADGYFMLAVGNDSQFRRLCEVIDAPALAADPRFSDNAARVASRTALLTELAPRLAARPMAYWLDRLQAAGVPCAPVHSLAQVFADPQVRARGLRFELNGAHGIPLPQVANPLRLSATPVAYRYAPPALGADTAAVLREVLGYGPETLDRLRIEGAIQFQ